MDLHKLIIEAISTAELEYISDVEFAYYNKRHKDKLSINFYKDSDGVKRIEEFAAYKKGIWFQMPITPNYRNMMFNILDNTPDREQEVEVFEEYQDPYVMNGVRREHFF